MSEEEPAWRAELREAIHGWDPYETEPPLRMEGGLLDTILPHIQAAEQRGREAALREAAKELETVATSLAARAKRDPLAFVKGASDARYHSALCWNAAARRVLELIDPDKP